jgi:hypothetical protein
VVPGPRGGPPDHSRLPSGGWTFRIRYLLLLIGILATLVFTLRLLKIPIGQLVLGGAITGILIGIAAQQPKANLFAGIAGCCPGRSTSAS